MDCPTPERDATLKVGAALKTRVRELEDRNRELEARIARAGEILGAARLLGGGRAQAWLAAIVENSDDAIVSKTLEGIITSWNPAAERILGYSAHEMIGGSIMRIIPPELRREEEHILGRIRSGQRIDHYETTRVRADGSRVRLSLTVSPVRDETGTIIGASKIARDVSPSLEAQRDRASLSAIVASSDDAIISKNLEGVVTSWNPAAERLYGYRAEEMIGQPIVKIIPPHLQEEEKHILARIRAGDRIDHFETIRQHKDGRQVEVSITVSPVRDAAGHIIGASKIARDIGPQRDAQRKKDRFLAVLAHELRNPLAPIRNAVSIFGRPDVTPEQRARAHQIAERQVLHMSRLLDDLLDVSRISNGRVELQRSRVELGALLDDALDAVRPLVSQRGHDLRVARPEEPIVLQADPVRITQVLVNLLTNAAKYTDPGGQIELAISRSRGHAVITVSDNGIGFEAGMAERLFTLFSQEPRAESRAAGGLGIGLALVREFVERHGGRIEGYSPGPDRGSRFTVRLPVAT